MNTDRDRLTPRLRRATVTALGTDYVDVSYQGADAVPVGWVGAQPLVGQEVSVLQAKGTGLVIGQINQDVWHTVGGAGEPAFGTNWANISGTRKTGFRLNGDKVELCGAAAVSVAVADGTTIFTLPVGYRPDALLRFSLTANVFGSTDSAIELLVQTTGAVQVTHFASTVRWGVVPFESVFFPLIGAV